jgi:hypothetical protein
LAAFAARSAVAWSMYLMYIINNPCAAREGSRRLRLLDFKTVGTWRGGKVSPTQRPPLPPRKYCWYAFLLEAESTPGPHCSRKVLCQFQLHHRESNPGPYGL